jgi:HSP20 family protein
MIPVVKYQKVPSIVDELLRNDFFGGAIENKNHYPSVNISENDSDYSINLALPGYNKGELKVSVDNNILTISYDHENAEDKKIKFLKREFAIVNFKKTFKLPENAEADKIEASHNNGILSIQIPKRAKVEIPVQDIKID